MKSNSSEYPTDLKKKKKLSKEQYRITEKSVDVKYNPKTEKCLQRNEAVVNISFK